MTVEMVGAIIAVGAFIILGIFVFRTGEVMEKGIRTTGDILKIQRLIGSTESGALKYQVLLEFETESGVVQVPYKDYLSAEDILKISHANKRVPIYYLPKNPNRVLIAFSEMDIL